VLPRCPGPGLVAHAHATLPPKRRLARPTLPRLRHAVVLRRRRRELAMHAGRDTARPLSVAAHLPARAHMVRGAATVQGRLPRLPGQQGRCRFPGTDHPSPARGMWARARAARLLRGHLAQAGPAPSPALPVCMDGAPAAGTGGPGATAEPATACPFMESRTPTAASGPFCDRRVPGGRRGGPRRRRWGLAK